LAVALQMRFNSRCMSARVWASRAAKREASFRTSAAYAEQCRTVSTRLAEAMQ